MSSARSIMSSNQTNAIADLVSSLLPGSYEPLLLTFQPKIGVRGDFARIGDDGGSELCVKLATGEILAIDPEGSNVTRFMNSSILQLGRCVLAHRDYAERVSRSRTEDEQLAAVAEFRRAIESIDSQALVGSENWWSVIVEQMEHGLL